MISPVIRCELCAGAAEPKVGGSERCSFPALSLGCHVTAVPSVPGQVNLQMEGILGAFGFMRKTPLMSRQLRFGGWVIG